MSSLRHRDGPAGRRTGVPTATATVALLVAAFGVPLLTPTGAPSRAPDTTTPDRVTVTVVMARPAGLAARARAQALDEAVLARVAARGGRVGPHRVRLVPVDSAEGPTGRESLAACAALTAALTADVEVDAVLDVSPSCLDREASELAAVGLPAVGPDDVEPSSTAGARGDDPSTAVAEGRGAARLLRDLGARRVWMLEDGSAVARELAAGFEADRARGRLTVAGRLTVDRARRDSVRRAGARVVAAAVDAVYLLVGSVDDGPGWTVLDGLRDAGFEGVVVTARRLHVAPPTTLRSSVDGLYLTSPDVPAWAVTEEARLTAAADRLLDAIARSDGTRGGIARVLPGVPERGVRRPLGVDLATGAREVAVLRVGRRGASLDRFVGTRRRKAQDPARADDGGSMRTDLLRIRQLAAAAAWQTPLGDEIHQVVTGLLTQLDERPEAVIVELDEQRSTPRLRAA